MMKFFVLCLIALFPAFSLGQTEGNPENWCRNGLFPRESKNYFLGTIKAKKSERVYFYGDDNNCPNGKNCRQRAYLVSGNEVIVSRKFGNWACGWYQPKKGSETVGWIPLKNLEFINLLQGTDGYVGTWRFYDSEIQIKKTADPKIFLVTGTAFWKGINNNVHVGELGDKAVWNGEYLAYNEQDKDEYACKVRLALLGSYLIVSDNLNCGGVNVTFSGVYRKK